MKLVHKHLLIDYSSIFELFLNRSSVISITLYN